MQVSWSISPLTSTPPLSAHLQRVWLRVNFDTGAAASVLPHGWAVAQENGGQQKFSTASGEELTDAGGVTLTGTSSLDRKSGCACV
eukprot:4766827-Amphidinium_carterae.1